MQVIRHLSVKELEAGLGDIRRSPRENGMLKMIARRPRDDERKVIDNARLDPHEGLVGDNWKIRGSKHTPDGPANLDAQLTIMNSRAIALLAQAEERWSLAGDQLYIDLDLSDENLPPGTLLALGSAVVEVSAEPHSGCRKFSERFGAEAMKFVNSPEGKRLRLRGINARVVQAGEIHVGDMARKVESIHPAGV